MGSIRTTAGLAAASVISLLSMIAATGTAAAASDSPAATPRAVAAVPSGCTAGNFCFWNNAYYDDGPGQVSGNNNNYTAFAHASCPHQTWNDCISSVYNDGTSGLGVAVYLDAGPSGVSWCVPDNTGYALLPTYYPNTTTVLNDSISANKWTSAC
ncbi:peptidase inhibitor family I36 protein [Streptomyces sp. NPDC091280]|uniref:peptidase inhibitor family I36 protein n=1 Tax=Streptomyces sp. NPDC091280 TaxID=3365984 RepID=UPI0037F461B4